MNKAGRIERLKDDKKPRSSKHHIGIEIEFACPFDRNAVHDAFVEAQLEGIVTVKDDGSLDGSEFCSGECQFSDGCECCDCPNAEEREANGCECDCRCNCNTHEVCVLVKESELLTVMRRICFILNNKLKAKVNASCGLHVHLDMRNRDARKAFWNLSHAQKVLFQMIPKSRRNNDYCKEVETFRLEEYSEEADTDNERYYAINAWALREHTTLEVRLHSGTTDYTKITNWVRLLTAVAEAPYFQKEQGTSQVVINSFERLLKYVKLNQGLIRFYTDRIKKFQGPEINNVSYEEAA